MRIGVLGTGTVGQALASGLVEAGHEVTMGSRAAGNDKAVEWAEGAGKGASEGDFATAAAHGEAVFNCTAGSASLEALEAAGAGNLVGKLLIDVSNPLDFSKGMPPTLAVANTDSLGERIQAAFPEARVVKTLNTINAGVMVDPGQVPGDHVIFLSGDDAEAKAEATGILGELGWPAERVIDLGDISTARGPEMYLPLWLRMMGALGTAHFNIAIQR
jgi:predicted dinucleotide-binding enzyme